VVIIIGLATKREDFSGVLYDVCVVPKQKRKKKVEPKRKRWEKVRDRRVRKRTDLIFF
jgi:hypothetical protein